MNSPPVQQDDAAVIAPFLPLARFALSSNKSDAAATERWTDWLFPLARLLEAVSRGVGQLPIAKVCPQLDLSTRPQHLIAHEGDMILLPRVASAWKRIRTWVETAAVTQTVLADDETIQQTLDAILPHTQEHGFDNAHQRLAVAALVDRRFGVLTGGPGTGKTTSAAALLAVRCRLERRLQPTDVLLCAPTGKAANRLQQSLRGVSLRLALAEHEREFLQHIVPQTVHRALGWSPKPPEQGGPFRFHAHHPLPHKLVIMDEASMTDVELMSQLIDALPDHASLLLLGDRDQLDSVEAGGVLSELVHRGAAGALPEAYCQRLAIRCHTDTAHINHWWREGLDDPGSIDQPVPGMSIGLVHSWRARCAPWVLELADLIRPGKTTSPLQLQDCFKTHAGPTQLTHHHTHASLMQRCMVAWLEHKERCSQWSLSAPPPQDELALALDSFQLLCATNHQIDQANERGIAATWGSTSQENIMHHKTLPHGCPLLIERNIRHLNLTNGDIGIALGDGPETAAHMVYFPDHSEPIPLAQLPDYRPAYGLTIHKSQGSEWKAVAIDMSLNEQTPINNNLLYTAVTRSSGSIDMHFLTAKG